MITIAEKQLTEIREHGIRDYPYECCGLLLGRFEQDTKTVTETYPISNAREESAKRNQRNFEIQVWLAQFRCLIRL